MASVQGDLDPDASAQDDRKDHKEEVVKPGGCLNVQRLAICSRKKSTLAVAAYDECYFRYFPFMYSCKDFTPMR